MKNKKFKVGDKVIFWVGNRNPGYCYKTMGTIIEVGKRGHYTAKFFGRSGETLTKVITMHVIDQDTFLKEPRITDVLTGI